MTIAEHATAFLLNLLSAACSHQVAARSINSVQELGESVVLSSFAYWIACEANAIEFP
jgi:hypothetical protein